MTDTMTKIVFGIDGLLFICFTAPIAFEVSKWLAVFLLSIIIEIFDSIKYSARKVHFRLLRGKL